MSFFKNRKRIFGEKISPDCKYCRYISEDEEPSCKYGTPDTPCKKYEYDPLKRTPMNAPALKHYSKDDFTL